MCHTGLSSVLFSLREVSFEYRSRVLDNPVRAISDISTDIVRGEFIALSGANASGKTTLALLLAGVMLPTSGKLLFDGNKTGHLEHPFDDISIIFQNPENTFVAPTLEEDIAFGPENAGMDPPSIRGIVDESLKRVGMENYALRHPATLSGGEQQLAALAGALACSPRVLVMDEATAYLDAAHRRLFLNLVAELNRIDGVTIVMTTQETDEMWMADRLMVLHEGRLAYDGPPNDLLLEPSQCSGLGIDADPLVNVVRYLKNKGLKMPDARPTPELMEEWLADNCRKD